MATAKNECARIGTFQCESGVLRVTDPCYSKNTWCAGAVPNCRTGTWIAEIDRKDCGDWGNRISRLTVTHELGGVGADEDAGFEVGVDSGQAGVFDDRHYPNDPATTAFYDQCCRLTLSRSRSGRIKYGVVSSSGYGDGGYSAAVRRDATGQCYRISVEFIGD